MITMDCSLFFRDNDGDLETVVFSYLDGCGDDPGPLHIDVRGQAGVQNEGTIWLENIIIQTNCAAGTYTYSFWALDCEDSESNILTLLFELDEPGP